MRASAISLTTQPQIFVDGTDYTKVFMIRNRSAGDTIYIQFGASAGLGLDAWPVLPGEVFALDPAAPKETIWVWGSVAAIPNVTLIG